MQCGFIKVVSMKRGSSNYKMYHPKIIIYFVISTYISIELVLCNIIRALVKWTPFRQLFYTVPKKLQRLLNTLYTIITAKDRFFSLYSRI